MQVIDTVQSGVDFFTGFARKRGLGKPDKIIIANETFNITKGVACVWNRDGEPIRNGLAVSDSDDCRKIYQSLLEWPCK